MLNSLCNFGRFKMASYFQNEKRIGSKELDDGHETFSPETT